MELPAEGCLLGAAWLLAPGPWPCPAGGGPHMRDHPQRSTICRSMTLHSDGEVQDSSKSVQSICMHLAGCTGLCEADAHSAMMSASFGMGVWNPFPMMGNTYSQERLHILQIANWKGIHLGVKWKGLDVAACAVKDMDGSAGAGDQDLQDSIAIYISKCGCLQVALSRFVRLDCRVTAIVLGCVFAQTLAAQWESETWVTA